MCSPTISDSWWGWLVERLTRPVLICPIYYARINGPKSRSYLHLIEPLIDWQSVTRTARAWKATGHGKVQWWRISLDFSLWWVSLKFVSPRGVYANSYSIKPLAQQRTAFCPMQITASGNYDWQKYIRGGKWMGSRGRFSREHLRCMPWRKSFKVHRLIIKKVVELMDRSRNSKTIMYFPLTVFQLISWY